MAIFSYTQSLRARTSLGKTYWTNVVHAFQQGDTLKLLHYNALTANYLKKAGYRSACFYNIYTLLKPLFLTARMKHEDRVYGAEYIPEKNRILTWSQDGTARLWDCGSDLDFPADKLILLVEALTGTTMDDFGNITVLDYESWKSKREQYLRVAEQHARSFLYKEHNLYLRDIK